MTWPTSRYALAVIGRIFDRGDQLSSQPYIGPTLLGYEGDGLRELFESPYRTIYRVLDAEIQIITVVHAARRLPKALGGNA